MMVSITWIGLQQQNYLMHIAVDSGSWMITYYSGQNSRTRKKQEIYVRKNIYNHKP